MLNTYNSVSDGVSVSLQFVVLAQVEHAAHAQPPVRAERPLRQVDTQRLVARQLRCYFVPLQRQ